jgi:hypothetical protein
MKLLITLTVFQVAVSLIYGAFNLLRAVQMQPDTTAALSFFPASRRDSLLMGSVVLGITLGELVLLGVLID